MLNKKLLGSVSSPPQDDNFENVTLLLNGDGTNGAQNNTFVDSSTNNFTITRNGNTTQGSFSPYGNLWSNYFNGTNAYLTAADNANWNINSSSTYSVEAWVFVSTSGVQTALTGALNRWWLGYNFTDVGATSNKFSFSVFNGSSWQTISSTTTPAVGTWYHVAATFDNGTTKLYLNGTQEATATSVTTNSSSGSLFVGAVLNPGYTYGFTGYLSNVRITKTGTLPYTANFTPSTTPLTATANTVMLTAQSNRFVDNSSNNFTITANGTPSVQRFSPFEPAEPYSTSVIGGSMTANGNSANYLSIASNSAFDQNGSFTIECWAYPSNISTSSAFLWYMNVSGFYSIFMSNTGRFNVSKTAVGEVYTSGVFPQNCWYHLALSYDGTNTRFYINGSLVFTGTGAGPTSGAALTIGDAIGVAPWNGYISDYRFVKAAVYTGSTLTVPTAPITAIANTSLLAKFQNAGIPDLAMQNNLETVGNAQVSTSVKKYGTGSLAFDGAGDYLFIKSIPDNQLGSGDFTVEGWFYANSPVPQFGYKFYAQTSSGNNYFLVTIGDANGANTNVVSVILNNSTTANSTATFTTGTWNHFAIVRLSGTVKVYLNGSGGTGASNTTNFYDLSKNIGIGSRTHDSNEQFNGYVDDLRITKGVARYTADFTPPVSALPTF